MLSMFLSSVAIDQDVINIRDAEDVKVLVKSFINVMLKRGRGVSEFKRQDQIFI